MDSSKGNNTSWKENSCFTFALDTQHKRKRAKFETTRKTEVATVRRKGACLRCRLLKSSCSGTRPCDNCVRAKLSSHVQVHKWMNCVTVSLRDVNVFKKVLPGSKLTNVKPLDIDTLFNVPIILTGDSHVVWTLDALAGHVSAWISDRKTLGFSRTGVLASGRLQTLLEPLLGQKICASLRALVLSSLMVYNLGFNNIAYVSQHREAFHLARATFAEEVLGYLEGTLTAPFLTKAHTDLRLVQALVILAFGAMRTLAYFDDTEIRDESNALYNKHKATSTCYDTTDMKDQLANTLAHFLVLLIDRLGDCSLRNRLPILLDNVQKHPTKAFISPLPICAPPTIDMSITSPSTFSAEPFSPQEDLQFDSFPQHWQENDLQDGGSGIQQWLCNDLDALDSSSSQVTGFDENVEHDTTYRECLLCTSPLCVEDHEALCISCQQPPTEMWPGMKQMQSNESSLLTNASVIDSNASNAAFLSGFNSLSTSLTSQDSVFDDMMSPRRPPTRTRLPTPVEEETEDGNGIGNGDDDFIFDAEDMDFGPTPLGPPGASTVKDLLPVENDDEFPPGWTLYWDDSCSESSYRDELDVF